MADDLRDRPIAAAEVRDALQRVVAGFEPERVTPREAAGAVAVFAEIERLAQAGRILAAGRVAGTTAWAGEGDRSADEWLAKQTGQSRADARRDLDAARQVTRLAGTKEALRQGRLTKEQVRELAPAASADPSAEQSLLADAARGPVDHLRGKARQVRSAARGDDRARAEAVRRRRSLTDGHADDGGHWLRASGPADAIARILAGLAPYARLAEREARRQGRPLRPDQAAFDALVAMASDVGRHGPASLRGHQGRGEQLVEPPTDGAAEPTGEGFADDSAFASPRHTDGSAPIAEPLAPSESSGSPGSSRPSGPSRPSGSPPGSGSPGSPTAPGSPASEPTASNPVAPPEPTDPTLPAEVPGRARWAAKVIVNVDLAALRRGHTEPGERCAITGIGPVPVTSVQDLLRLDDTFLAAVVREGRDVVHVAHLGRGPTAVQRTALEAMFDTCCIDGCPDPPVVVDHHHPWARNGPRTLDNLGPLCAEHDDRKTNQRWVLVRQGDSRRLLPPDHPAVRGRGALPGGCLDLRHDEDGVDGFVGVDAAAGQAELPLAH